MMVTADMREDLLLRIDREPYAHIFERLQDEAEREIREPEMETWDHNGDIMGNWLNIMRCLHG